VVDVRDVITPFKFGDDRLRGLGSAEGQSLPFPIDFDGRPYSTPTLPCERVIDQFCWLGARNDICYIGKLGLTVVKVQL